MGHSADSLCKVREIVFSTLHPDEDQAGSAVALLADVAGIHNAQAISPSTLEVAYHLLEITLEEIESLLTSGGFHLDNGLVYKLRRALHHYTEETQRANLGCAKGEANCTQKVFINRYFQRDHGCQDDRPEHQRRYL